MSIYVAPKKAALPVKASPQGPGAGILQTTYPLASLLSQQTPQRKMALALKMGVSVPWIRAAELTIGGAFQSVSWHLEDDNEEHIEEGEAYHLIAYPQANLQLDRPWKRLTRAELWRLTCRHVGLAGNAFWYLDQLDGLGIPQSILYIRPDRMSPDEDAKGNLTGWYIDRTSTDPGIFVNLTSIVQYMLEPPDHGHFGIGLVESALLKAEISGALDRHLAAMLDAGGRLSGFLSPKTGTIGPDQMVSMERDWRSIVEQTDAAKRLQIVAAPVDFTPTVMDNQDIGLRDLMIGARDDLLGLWGVPVAKLGIHDRGAGLQGGTITEQDTMTLWQQGVMPRLGGQDQGGFVETLQANLLDRFLPEVVELLIDEPTFDDDAPKYEAAQKALQVPLRTAERRDILGLEPFGPEVRNPETGVLLDDEVWMPIGMGLAFAAPSDGTPVKAPEPEPVPVIDQTDTAAGAAGETAGGAVKAGSKRTKPLQESLVKLRTQIDQKMTPRVRSAVTAFLDEQRRDIAQRLRDHAKHIVKTPGDTSVWFPDKAYDKRLAGALGPTLGTVATQVTAHLDTAFGAHKAAEREDRASDPIEKVLLRGAARVTRINETTRDRIRTLIAQALAMGRERGVDAEATILEVAAVLETEAIFDHYRAELIARTEVMDAYNAAALASYSEHGIEEVQAIDGDEDPECAERDGQVFSLTEADAIEDHPNGTLDWIPIIPEFREAAKSDVKALIETLAKREPISVTVITGNETANNKQTVIDYDDNGDFMGYHEVVMAVRDEAGSIALEAD